jgi:sulfur carrier protein
MHPWQANSRAPGDVSPYASHMTVIVNAQDRELPERASVADLVRALGLEKAACAVEVNKHLIPKAKHPDHTLNSGDRIEVVTLVGGG